MVGLGGHVDPGETAAAAAVREAREEAAIEIAKDDLHQAGKVRFRFPAKPSWNQEVAVFTTTTWRGSPAPSEEITPHWYALDQVPLEAMWDDARHWLPGVLAGQAVDLTITFHTDNRTVASVRPGT